MARKILLDNTISMQEIIATYKVSRTTAWRAKNSGWLVLGYHQPTQDYNDFSVLVVGHLVARDYSQLRQRLVNRWRNQVPVHIIEDALSDSVLRCLERSQELLDKDSNISAWVYNGTCYILRTTLKSYCK